MAIAEVRGPYCNEYFKFIPGWCACIVGPLALVVFQGVVLPHPFPGGESRDALRVLTARSSRAPCRR